MAPESSLLLYPIVCFSIRKEVKKELENEATKDPDLSGHNPAKFKIINILTDLRRVGDDQFMLSFATEISGVV